MIGETIDESNDICGARILDKVSYLLQYADEQSKPQKKTIGYRLEIWFKDWKDEDMKTRLNKKVRSILSEFNLDGSITFKDHIARW